MALFYKLHTALKRFVDSIILFMFSDFDILLLDYYQPFMQSVLCVVV